MKIVARAKREAKDLLIIAVIGLGGLLIAALCLAGVAWEILKVVAVVKFIGWF